MQEQILRPGRGHRRCLVRKSSRSLRLRRPHKTEGSILERAALTFQAVAHPEYVGQDLVDIPPGDTLCGRPGKLFNVETRPSSSADIVQPSLQDRIGKRRYTLPYGLPNRDRKSNSLNSSH